MNLHTWLRKTYLVEEPVRRADRVGMVVAYERLSPEETICTGMPHGREIDRWFPGARPHIHVWTRYLEENPDVAELAAKEQHHRSLHLPLEVRLR